MTLLVAAQCHAAPKRQQRVRDPTQHHHDDSSAWVLFDPRVVIFFEGNVEDLVRGFNAPVTPHEQEPLGGAEAWARQAGNEVAILRLDTLADSVERFQFDTQHGA